jgi:DNA-binding XRE family transcriptional regulator
MDFEGPGKAQPLPWDGRRIIALRGELHLSQDDLARTLQIRLKTLRTWEDGRGYAAGWVASRLDRLEKKLGKSQAMTEVRRKSAVSTVRSPEEPTRKAARPRARVRQSPAALRLARLQKDREIRRLLRRLG